jgi:hypothetical protein
MSQSISILETKIASAEAERDTFLEQYTEYAYSDLPEDIKQEAFQKLSDLIVETCEKMETFQNMMDAAVKNRFLKEELIIRIENATN